MVIGAFAVGVGYLLGALLPNILRMAGITVGCQVDSARYHFGLDLAKLSHMRPGYIGPL
jgi:hypothetical protein